jgi:hypothetical protein
MMMGGLALAATMVSGGAMAQTPAAAPAPAAKPTPEYVAIVQEISVARPADDVWKKIGGYCDIGGWFHTTCTYTVGDGGLGTNRLIGGRINEVLVAKTAYSYTYAQPLSPISYHGTVEVRPEGANAKIIYTIFYDASNLPDQAAKDKDKAGRAKMFMGVLSTMKTVAEAK